MKIKIAENIRKFRKERSLTQEQLAEALGVTVGAVYKWEAGLSTPEIKLIMELADLFEVSVDVLLGYERQNGNLEAIIDRIEQYIMEQNFDEVIVEAEKALKKYPNNFEVVYRSAVAYQLKYLDDKEEKAIEKSTVLFKQAVSLLYQNTNEHISEVTINNNIAENYLMIGKTEQALESLKKNNVCGINNSQIGLIYAMMLKQPAEAKPYLIKSFADSLKIVLQTILGMSKMYEELNDKKGLEAILWLIGFLDSIKVNSDSIAFTDKIKATLMSKCAIWEAASGDFDKSREYINNAYSLANQFDETPAYSTEGIVFFEEDDTYGVLYDDIGKTAIEAIENTIYDEEKENNAYRFVQKIWEELIDEERG